MLPLQAFSGIHIGVDNLNVLGGVATLIDHGNMLTKDGDLLASNPLTARFRSPRSRGMPFRQWLKMVTFGKKI